MTEGTNFPIAIAEVHKNSRENVHIALTEFSNYRLIDIRVYAAGKATPKGLALQLDRLPDLILALQNAEAKAREMGLLAGGTE